MRVLIDGFYGNDNLGDDYILYSILNTISKVSKSRQDCIDVDVICNKEYNGYEWISKIFKNINFSMVSMPHSVHNFRRYTHWIIGGGGLFPKEQTDVLVKKYILTCVAKIAGTKIVIYGVEINPIKKKTSRMLWDMIRRNCDFVYLRNLESLQVFDRRDNVKSFADVTFALKTAEESDKTDIEQFKKINYTLYAVAMPWSDDELSLSKYQKRYWRLVDLIVEYISQDANYPVFIPFYSGKDQKMINDIINKLDKEYKVIQDNRIGIKRLYFKYAKKCICMRFHSVLFSLYNATAFFAISYSPKTTSVLQENGLENICVELGVRSSEFFYKEFDVDESKFWQKVNQLNSPENLEKIATARDKLIHLSSIAENDITNWLYGETL